MSAPAPPASFSTIRAGVRQALIDAVIVGRAVYHPSGLDQARAPYIVLSDRLDATLAQSGDGRGLQESTTGEAALYQANSRDADPALASKITRALDGLRFVVGTGADATNVAVRAASPTKTEAEGLDERIVRWTAYHRVGTP